MPDLTARQFAQVDVFTDVPYMGNPVAVVLNGEGISDEGMFRFARWTNLSETTFVLPPTDVQADYRLRVFTPTEELPFAGHPTLGSAHAWLTAGGTPKTGSVITQECEVGLVQIRVDGGVLRFKAPDRIRTGPLDDELVDAVARGLRIEPDAIVRHQWVDNGSGWIAVQLASADEVLALQPDEDLVKDLRIGVVGAYPEGAAHRFEVRAFAAPSGTAEDPVTGSLNAGIAQWLIGEGAAPSSYTVGQGRRVGRDGVISVEARDDEVWVGGSCITCIEGTVVI